MLYPIKQLGQHGIIKDLAPSELPDNAWTDGNNVAFRDSIAQRIMGESDVFGGGSYSPEKLMFYPDPQSGTAYWIYAGFDVTDMRILSWDGANHTDRTGVDVGDPYVSNNAGWTNGVVAGVPFFNNGTGAPWVWLRTATGVDLDALMVQMSTWPTGMVAEQLRSFRNFYIAMDITESGGARNPSRLWWSHPAEPYLEPASWDIADPAYLAGDVVLGDTSDYLMDCLPLRGNNIVYKRNETWQMRRINTNAVFAFDRLFRDTGLIAPRCATAFKGTYHFMVTNQQDFIIHDGNTRQSVADAKVRKAIFTEIDPECCETGQSLTRSFVALNATEEEIWYCYPRAGSTRANRAAIWNYERNTWSFRDLNQATDMAFGIPTTTTTPGGDAWDTGPDTPWDTGDDIPWASFFNSVISSSEVMSHQGGFLKIDDTDRFEGSDYTSFLEKRGIDFGEPSRRKIVQGVHIKALGTLLKVSVGGAANINGPYTFESAKNFNPAIDYKVDFRRNDRYFAFRFESDNEFRIDEYAPDVTVRGIR